MWAGQQGANLEARRVPGPDGCDVADLASQRHVDGRERVRVDVLRLIVELLVEEHVQTVVHPLRAIVRVHVVGGSLPLKKPLTFRLLSSPSNG